MPTNRRHRQPRRRGQVLELTAGQEHELLTGSPFLDGFESVEVMQLAWEVHRDELMADYVAEHPGRRPLAWWLFEGVGRYGERPVIDRSLTREQVEAHRVHGVLNTRVYPFLQEPEEEFLHRAGELSAAEWRACQPRLAEDRANHEDFTACRRGRNGHADSH